MSGNFFSLPNQCNLIVRAYRLTSPFLAIILYYWHIFPNVPKVFQIWPTRAGYEEFSLGFWASQQQRNLIPSVLSGKKKCICQPRYRNISKNFFNNLILANKERALAVRSSVFDHLTSKVYDAKQIVHRLQETLEWNQASLEQPNHEAKKWIRSLTREARRSERLDVVKYLREITPAGTTGECVFCSSVFLFLFFSFFFFYREYLTFSCYLFLHLLLLY